MQSFTKWGGVFFSSKLSLNCEGLKTLLENKKLFEHAKYY